MVAVVVVVVTLFVVACVVVLSVFVVAFLSAFVLVFSENFIVLAALNSSKAGPAPAASGPAPRPTDGGSIPASKLKLGLQLFSK